MQTTPKITFHVIVKENNRTVRSFAVFPDGVHMVAVSPRTLRTGNGPRLTYGYKDNDILVDGVRYRSVGRQGKDYVVVPWTKETDG